MTDFFLVLRLLRRWWWLILIPVLIMSVVAVPELLANEQTGAGGYRTEFRYSAAQEEANLPDRDGDYQDVWLASEFVVNAFTDWVRTSSFRAELEAALPDDLNLAPLGIAADNDRSIGLVIMTYPTPDDLQQIADAAIEVLQTRNNIYFPHLGDEPAEVVVLDAPTVTPSPPPLTNRFAPLLQLGVALFIGLGLAVLAEYFDPTLRDRDELERTGLNVLGSIPRHR